MHPEKHLFIVTSAFTNAVAAKTETLSESEQKDDLKVLPCHRRFEQMPKGRAADEPLMTVWRSNWAE